MQWDHIIRNGTIVNSKDMYQANIYIKDGKIATVTSEELEGDALEATDATGLYVLPGLMDVHVHSRDQGATHKEDFYHSTQAAAAGGITTVFEMPNTNPPVNNVANMKKQIENLEPKAHVDFALWAICLGQLNLEDIEALSEEGVIAFKFFWGYAIDSKTFQLIYNYDPNMKDVISPLKDGEVYEIFKKVSETGKVLSIHAENHDLIEYLSNKVEESGERSYDAFLEGRPNLAEETTVQTAIAFAKKAGTNLHILHVSSGEAIDHIEQAQLAGYPITSETCPHYLFLNNEDFDKVGPKMKVYPPVKYKKDQERLWEGIQEQIISLVCSDHAPHTEEEKTGDLWSIPAGMCGVETLVPLMLNAINEGKINLNQLVSLLSENPAKRFGIYPHKGSLQVGTDADITLVDLNKKHMIKEELLHSKSKITAFDGFEVTGAPVGTIVRGKTVMKNGEIVSQPFGKFIRS